MGVKPRNKMPISDRAKQFMPFAALKGLPEALAAREKVTVERIELSPDRAEELDRQIHKLKPGEIITAVYFHKDEYIKVTGMAARIDASCRLLQIVNTKIPFDDILFLSLPDT